MKLQFENLLQTNLIKVWAREMGGICQNCGKLLEDSFLTHCSMKCLYEDYLKSKSARSGNLGDEDLV